MVTRDEYAEATERGKRIFAAPTAAMSAHYDRVRNRIVVRLRSGLEISFSPKDAQGFEEATPAQLSEIEISPLRDALLFPRLDEGIWIPGMLEGIMGTRKWMAARLGQAGGQATSPAKKAASRANGKLGGRPRKAAKR